MTSWREDRRPVERIERVALDDLHERWEADRDGVQVLDVRERDEWDAGHIPGSVFTPYHDITRRARASSTATAPSPSSARQASAPRSARACCRRTARGGMARGRGRRAAVGAPGVAYGSTLSSRELGRRALELDLEDARDRRLEGDRLGLVRLELLLDVVAVDVDLLRRVAADAEADGLALVVGQRLHLAGLQQRRRLGRRGRRGRRRGGRLAVGGGGRGRRGGRLRRVGGLVRFVAAAREQDHRDDRDDRPRCRGT